MAHASLVVDTSFVVALWRRNDQHHRWAVAVAKRHPPPWATCEAVLGECDHLLGRDGGRNLRAACRRGALCPAFDLKSNFAAVLDLMEKYADMPMSLADACLVRMTELLPEPLLLTADDDFRTYRRLGRKVIPVLKP